MTLVMYVCAKSLRGELWGWTCFYVSVASAAFGSSYYHLNPDHDRLVWDRLPVSSFPSMEVEFTHYNC